MSSIDLTTILGNLSLSLLSVEHLIVGFGYLLGIVLVISGLIKLTKISKYSHEGPSGAIASIFGGAVLIFLPSSFQVISNTFFGSSSVLQYTPYRTYNVYDTVQVLVQTAGLVWFIRGAVLLVHAAEPGKQKGSKGLFFIIAGVFAMNFNYTVASLNTMFLYFMGMASKVVS